MTDRPIRSVAVVGGGIVGLSAAAAFARTLPQVGVTVIETPVDPAALIDRLPGSHPSIARFHAMIGIEEAELIASGAATWRIGTRYRQWSPTGADWYHVTGQHGPRLGTIDFHHLWARAARSGQVLPYFAYAAVGALARDGKFVLPVDDPDSPLASYDYSLRLKPDLYREILARHCIRSGVAMTAGSIAVDRDSAGDVVAIVLPGGRRVTADLYIDCSGPAAPLSPPADARFEDWDGYLPNVCVAIAGCDDAPEATDDIVRTPAGWSWRSPGAGRGTVILAGGARAPADGGVVVRPGRRPATWQGNVLLIADAAVSIDPLGWFGLHLAHLAIERALELLPSRDFGTVELAEYDRRCAIDATAVRDLAALFYRCPGAPEGAFWRAVSALSLPDSLAATAERFRRRGYFAPLDEDMLGRDTVIAALIGLGNVPDAIDPLADAMPPDVCTAAMARWAENVQAIARQLPPYRDYLADTLRHLGRARR